MGYTMDTDGSVVLPVDVEPDAVTAAAAAMAPLQGWFPQAGDAEARTLDDLGRYVGAALTRDGDRIRFGTDEEGDPKWSDQATAFYLALAPYVSSGEVRFVGEDDAEWRYRYERGSVRQAGINGWDGSDAPFGPPADLAEAPPDLRGLTTGKPASSRPFGGTGRSSRAGRRDEERSRSNLLGLSPTALSLLIGITVLVVLVLAL